MIETGFQMSWRDKYLKLHCKERVTLVEKAADMLRVLGVSTVMLLEVVDGTNTSNI